MFLRPSFPHAYQDEIINNLANLDDEPVEQIVPRNRNELISSHAGSSTQISSRAAGQANYGTLSNADTFSNNLGSNR
jgi:hypothetical protein